MGKIRRGGYVFVTWIGDHSPYHVHVYRDRELVLKWDLENDVPMKGEASRRLLDLTKSSGRKGYCEDQDRNGQQPQEGV